MSKDTKPDVWFPLVVGDYLKDTSRLTTEQHGAYLLLLMDYWVNGPPADDDEDLAEITRLDAKTWRKTRPKIQRFFTVVDGVWRQKRADEELARWTEKKRAYVERAAAGGRAKAAKSTSTSRTKAVLEGCSSSAAVEVDGPPGHSTLYGQNEFLGPKEVRDAFAAQLGPEWCVSYLDHCQWQDIPDRALIPATSYAANKIITDGRPILRDLEISVLGKAA